MLCAYFNIFLKACFYLKSVIIFKKYKKSQYNGYHFILILLFRVYYFTHWQKMILAVYFILKIFKPFQSSFSICYL